MHKRFLPASMIAALGMAAASHALARPPSPDQETSTQRDTSAAERDTAAHKAAPGDPIPGIDITHQHSEKKGKAPIATDPDDDGDGLETQRRKKLEKLPHAPPEKPLETMDETDPCPTLPC